jgi:hypothetical protein
MEGSGAVASMWCSILWLMPRFSYLCPHAAGPTESGRLFQDVSPRHRPAYPENPGYLGAVAFQTTHSVLSPDGMDIRRS